MKKTVIALAATLALMGLATAAPPQGTPPKTADAPKAEDTPKTGDAPKKDEAPKQHPGRLVYNLNRCWMCHSIDGKGNKKTPLDHVGSNLYPDQIKKWILSPKEMKPETRMSAYDKLSEKDLADLVEYLSSLK